VTEHQQESPQPAEKTVLEQMGGVSGIIYSSVPVLIFVPVNSIWSLAAAIWAAVGASVAILALRLYRREPIQPAISAFFGVAVCAFIAYRTGDAKGYFLFGIYSSLAYGAVFLVSILARWPLVGVIWGFLNGHGNDWRAKKSALRAYDLATLAWAVVFGARYLVQSNLYDTDQTGWLAFARIAMGWPLAAVALVISIWAARRADHVTKPKTVDSSTESHDATT
jgi:FtsH-binding integral membrane protein